MVKSKSMSNNMVIWGTIGPKNRKRETAKKTTWVVKKIIKMRVFKRVWFVSSENKG